MSLSPPGCREGRNFRVSKAFLVERRMPFEVKAPNVTTRKAIVELEASKGKRFANVDALMTDLHTDD